MPERNGSVVERESQMACQSLQEALASIPDPRDPRGIRHPLPAMLSLCVVAILAGMTSLEAIAQFGRDHGTPLAHALGFRRGKTPTKSAFSKLFRRLDIQAFEDALRRWTVARQAEGWQMIAIDGKTLKGSADGVIPGIHLLSAFIPEAAAVLAQLRVDAKTNEHKAALQLLGILPLAGKVVTGDAMFTHRDVAAEIRNGEGDYLLIVKDNQATLKADIAAAVHGTAAFSPLGPEARGRGTDGADGGQGTRTAGDSPIDQYDDVE
jgi:hypothetical protein